ncbi:MAG: hypothetical protein EHM70_11330 [Chloroflexota bacterium]|nr:MAG: hypothetical protein EHM70_11330 [Chloroflexota bacterium]
MFNNRKETLVKPFEIGDSAIDGLFGGMLAGFVMEIYLTMSGLLSDLQLSDALTRISPIQGPRPVSGVLLHFAVSGIYGILFGLVFSWVMQRQTRRHWGWIAGTAYGALLLLMAVVFILPNNDSAIGEIPLIHLTVAHLLYGLILGLSIKR